MKRLTLMLLVSVFAIAAKAQYNVGTSSTTTDYFGNTTTTYQDRNGNNQGTSKSTTDYFGNRNTLQQSNNSNTTIWSW